MKAVESSLSYRSLRAAFGWASLTAQHSVTGRTITRVARAVGPALAGSRVFGTGRITSSTIEDGRLPLTVAALARPTLAVQASVSAGAPGRILRAAGAAAVTSAFAGGEWTRLVGAGMLGLGLGMMFSRPGISLALILVGLLLAAGGPVALAAVRSSRVAWLAGLHSTAGPERHAAARAPSGRLPWIAILLCTAAGVMAGTAPEAGTRQVLAFALLLAAAGVALWRPEAILLVVAAFPWLDWAARGTLGGLGPLWDDALLVVSAGLLAWSVFVLGRVVPRTVPVALPLLLMLAAAVASIVVRGVPGDVGIYALRVLFEPILFYFVGFLFPKDVRWVRWAVTVFVLACTALALHGIYQYITHAPMPENWVDVTETGIAVRAYSVVQNPNVLGGLLAMGGLITGSLALSRSFRGGPRLLLVVACLVQLLGLAVTFSRGAWLGLAVGLLATIVLGYRRCLFAFIGAAVVVWFAAPRVFIDRLLFAFSTNYATRSSAGLGRIYRWDAALQHFADHPLLGVGFGTFGGTAAYMFGYWALWVDNFYLQMAAEGGLLLLVFFLWLLLRGAKGLVRGHRVSSDPYLKALTAGMFGAFLALIVADAFEADWETLSVAVPFWFLAGLVTSAALNESAPGGGSTGEALAAPGRTPAADGEAAT